MMFDIFSSRIIYDFLIFWGWRCSSWGCFKKDEKSSYIKRRTKLLILHQELKLASLQKLFDVVNFRQRSFFRSKNNDESHAKRKKIDIDYATIGILTQTQLHQQRDRWIFVDKLLLNNMKESQKKKLLHPFFSCYCACGQVMTRLWTLTKDKTDQWFSYNNVIDFYEGMIKQFDMLLLLLCVRCGTQ